MTLNGFGSIIVTYTSETEMQMNKEYEINEALKSFTDRTESECPDAFYCYQAGYFETVIRSLLLRATDEDRELVLKQLIGQK